ncbi:MAG: GNAT family N-acetyltransferase [Porticoccaceae bacterium]|nr:GNAT family N-acetyltransferase [Porticoccaceae bacterium]
MGFKVDHKVLKGRAVELHPLTEAHVSGLFAIGQDHSDWQYLPIPGFEVFDDAQRWVDQALSLQEKAEHLVYVLVEPVSRQVMGSSRYLNIRERDAVLEIGYSWLGVDFQRSAVNTEAKYLLLRNAFQTMGARRVELKTDARNIRSQKAIARIGATREGVLRSHMTVQNGFQRDSVMYSIIDSEWPDIKVDLLEKMQAYHEE